MSPVPPNFAELPSEEKRVLWDFVSGGPLRPWDEACGSSV